MQKSQARRENIYVHPFWLSGSHDLAVIQLDPLQPFRLNSRVQAQLEIHFFFSIVLDVFQSRLTDSVKILMR